MNKTNVVALCTVAFLIGEGQALYRANRRIKKLSRKNDILQMKVTAFCEFTKDVYGNELHPMEAAKKFNEAADFINLIDEL